MSNVHDQLSKTKPGIVNRIISNQEVTGLVMGYINVFHGLKIIKHLPIEQMKFGEIMDIGNDVFACDITWDVTKSIFRLTRWTKQTDIEQFAKARADYFAETLRENPEIEKLIVKIVEALERWAEAKGCAWENIKIDEENPHKPVVLKDLHKLAFRVKKKLGLVHAG